MAQFTDLPAGPPAEPPATPVAPAIIGQSGELPVVSAPPEGSAPKPEAGGSAESPSLADAAMLPFGDLSVNTQIDFSAILAPAGASPSGGFEGGGGRVAADTGAVSPAAATPDVPKTPETAGGRHRR